MWMRGTVNSAPAFFDRPRHSGIAPHQRNRADLPIDWDSYADSDILDRQERLLNQFLLPDVPRICHQMQNQRVSDAANSGISPCLKSTSYGRDEARIGSINV